MSECEKTIAETVPNDALRTVLGKGNIYIV